MIALFIGLAVAGLGIGILSGLLGVGGGTVMVPLFRLVVGMSPVGSTATSLFTIIPTSLSGAFSHFRNKTRLVPLGLAMGLGGACTSPVGAWLAQHSPGWAVMVASAIAIAYSSGTMLKKAVNAPKTTVAAGVSNTGQDTTGGKINERRPLTDDAPVFGKTQLIQGAGIGLLTGIVSGYIGLGGGFIMVPLMLSLYKMPMKIASGTSLVAIILIALPATILQCWYGNVDYLAGIAIACGSIPGALIGARLASKAPERALRFTFAAFLGVAALLMVLREVGLFG